MELKVNITTKQISVVLVCCLLSGLTGFMLSNLTPTYQENQNSVCPTELNLSQKDVNTLAGLTFVGGHCERLGLQSSVYVQQDVNGNKYGVPICVEPKVAK